MTVPSQDSVSCEEAAALLVAASAVDVDTDRGETIELWTITNDGAAVSASGPRLSVAGGMHLTCRLAAQDGALHIVAVIETAEYRSASRAVLTLRVVEVTVEGHERRAPRLPINAPATLEALVCDRLVPGAVIAVSLTNLSVSGAGLTTIDSRIRAGDRLQLTARFIEGLVACEVRIAYVAGTPKPGVLAVGCLFLDPDPTTDTVNRVLARLNGRGPPSPPSWRLATPVPVTPGSVSGQGRAIVAQG